MLTMEIASTSRKLGLKGWLCWNLLEAGSVFLVGDILEILLEMQEAIERLG